MKARLLLFPFLMFPFTWSWLELIKVVVTVFAFFDRDEVVDRSKRVHQLHLRSGVELWRVIVDSPLSSEDFVGVVYHAPEGAMLTVEQLIFGRMNWKWALPVSAHPLDTT
jgi:hypothetical protein